MTLPDTRRAILTPESEARMVAVLQQKNFFSFDLVEAETGIPAVLLRKLVRDGVLRGSAPYRVAGVFGECDLDQAREIAARLEAARAPVEGIGILATEAAAKYGFSDEAIYRWYEQGWVAAVRDDVGRNRLFNEGDVAFAAALAALAGHKQGKRVFPGKK